MNAQDTSVDPQANLQLEIAHLLLFDVVGYSKLLVNEQIEVLQELNRIVRSTECVRAAEKNLTLIRVPTGDGMALLFFRSPEEPARCAIEISRELKKSPHIQVRMGIHSGPIHRTVDVNEQSNVAGAGINVAQRVMDCGDAGHILLSKHVADDLTDDRHWRPYLHDLGECEVKHGLQLHIFSLYNDEVGNNQLPEKLRRGRRWRETTDAIVRPFRAGFWPALGLSGVLLLGAMALAAVFLLFSHRISPVRPRSFAEFAAIPIPDKSIAVLPFENLSDDKQNAYFADGVQDEILTDLTKVADLKVISRTSVMAYRNTAQRNLREIAKSLGVAHVLEGTVRRIGDRIRVSAQLIDARTDNHLWAERYDRNLSDVFAIENELAEKIVAQLKSKLSAKERAAIEQRPTFDLPAYDLYVRAKTLIQNSATNTPQRESLVQAIGLLSQALQRDPAFALAHYQLGHAHNQLYFTGGDHTPARLAMAEAEIQALSRLLPNSGEAHLARAEHFYFGYLDYDGARQELELAKQGLPNDPLPFLLAGYIDRRQSRWDESTVNLQRAIELDPRNPAHLQQIAKSYQCLSRYADAQAAMAKALALDPADAATRISGAMLELDWHADPRPAVSAIDTVLAENRAAAANIAEQWLFVSRCQRDADTAQRAAAALPMDGCHVETIPFPHTWCEGLVAQIKGDTVNAHAAFTAARNEMVQLTREQPNYAEAQCARGIADAFLGYKEDAIREGRRAVELLPVTKDAIVGAYLAQYLALIYAWTGEKDLAFEQLETAAKLPGYLCYGWLRLDPLWDPLRDDPRFDKIVASLAPK